MDQPIKQMISLFYGDADAAYMWEYRHADNGFIDIAHQIKN